MESEAGAAGAASAGGGVASMDFNNPNCQPDAMP